MLQSASATKKTPHWLNSDGDSTTNNFQGIIPEDHLIWNWSPTTGTNLAPSNELHSWTQANSPRAQFHQSKPNVNNVMSFDNEEEYALAKLVWGLQNTNLPTTA